VKPLSGEMMHLLTTTATSLDEIAAPVDLRQPPGDVAVLSFADSDLAALAAAWTRERDTLPSVRIANLRDLKHPMSVDLWIERVAAHAKVILVRLLGGPDWWRYGVDQLAALARAKSIKLALLPGEDRDDPRLAEASTLPGEELALLLRFFREGGIANMRALLRRLACHAGDAPLTAPEPRPVPRLACYLPGEGAVDMERLLAWVADVAEPSVMRSMRNTSQLPTAMPRTRHQFTDAAADAQASRARPVVAVIFYRALLLAGDTAAIDALCAALTARGLAPAALVVTSLKEAAAAAFVRDALARLKPAVIVTTTAFAAGGDLDGRNALDGADVPVLQAVIAATARTAWREGPRGLGAADLAMHVILPELDGRVLAGAIAFKDPRPAQDGPACELAFTALSNRPEPDRIDAVADRVATLARLQATPRSKRRIAIMMPDYPGGANGAFGRNLGRAGYAVGLDVPESVVALIADLAAAGYEAGAAPPTARALIDAVDAGCPEACLARDVYRQLAENLPAPALRQIHDAWGDPAGDPELIDCGLHENAFQFRARWFGNMIVAVAPDRGRRADRRADYHDAARPPRHALVAFWLWLRHVAKADAVIHMGAHGTLEWLPGKAVALTAACFPDALAGPLPMLYPFIVSNPGEAAQAKRRIAAVTISHLPPPLADAELAGDAGELVRLVDEYAQADGLDRKRRERLAGLIIDRARRSGLAREAGLAGNADPDTALRRIDAWLCDLKDLAVKDGLHVYGRVPGGGRAARIADPLWQECAAAERAALLAGLDGRRVAPGPAGAPGRGRLDVLPTGRNMFTADPRMLPTPTAVEFGQLAADEIIRLYMQTHGDMPRALVIDLWGSATLRTGGEEIAQGLALMGCRPIWDSTGRVTGIEVLPPAAAGRPRVDVTWRISGLFRDLFPAQIALIGAAVRAVETREETDSENPLAAARRAAPDDPAALARIFGTAPGAYGAGIEDMLGREGDRDAIAAAYLAAASHAYEGAEGAAAPSDRFAARVAGADLLVHGTDDPGRDLLEGGEDAAFIGGFAAAAGAAAAAGLGRAPDLIVLDATRPERPRARPLGAALARIVRARAVNPKFIAGLMRHGPRGAAELAETVERLIAFAQTTSVVESTLIDLVYDAYIGDPPVREFLVRENPAAARAIAECLECARRNGWWHPRRNDIDAELRALMAEAAA
jgi:cobaltochelatase CobN